MSRVSGGWDADEIILSAPNLYSGKPKSLVTVLAQNQRVCMIQSSGTEAKEKRLAIQNKVSFGYTVVYNADILLLLLDMDFEDYVWFLSSVL